MKNYIQNGENITVTAPADVVSGTGVLIGKLFGVATGDAKSGADVTLTRRGVFSLGKVSTQAWVVGQKLYWNGTKATTIVSTNTPIGVAVGVAADPSETGIVLLDGAIS